MSKLELQNECKLWGLQTGGNKPVLLTRLENNIRGQKILPFKLVTTTPIKRARCDDDDDEQQCDDDDDALQTPRKQLRMTRLGRKQQNDDDDDEQQHAAKEKQQNEADITSQLRSNIGRFASSKDDDDLPLKLSTATFTVTDDHVLQEPSASNDLSCHKKDKIGPFHSFKRIASKQNSPKTKYKPNNNVSTNPKPNNTLQHTPNSKQQIPGKIPQISSIQIFKQQKLETAPHTGPGNDMI